ncbi:MAG: AMP-binding protein [Pyrinomonadaceae bacterium]
MTEKSSFEHQPIAWKPTEETVEKARLTEFMRQTGAKTFDELYRKSIENVAQFTAEVLKFLDIKFNPPYEKLLDLSDGAAFPQWCAGAGLNITEMCLDRWQTGEMKNQPAIIWEGEEGKSKQLTYGELQRKVNYVAAGLRFHGLGKGDAIGIHLPMMFETVEALLAIGRIGAIAVPVFSGYGVEAIASRLRAVAAKALITCDKFPRRGKNFHSFGIAAQAASEAPSIEKFFIIEREMVVIDVEPDRVPMCGTGRREGRKNWEKESPVRRKQRIVDWLDLWQDGMRSPIDFQQIEKTAAEDPLIILYTSGTTGKPKGIAHTHCSFPVKAAQDMAFGTDVGRGTRISWITDIGWMMGPWLIYGALINGATICIYDGAPDYPTADRMWEFCAKHKVEILGISPTLVRALATHGDDLPKKHDLSNLRAFASTGEPWNPAPWWWLFEKVGNSKLPIINYSGGTEISGGILMDNPLLPIKPCGFSAPCPGIDAWILDDKGASVGANQVGELAIKKPWIGMARGFWQERERYLETYWSRFENIWVHGDWAMRDADGYWFILGRSDDTLKVAGKRVGPAEVESLLVAHPLVTEAAVIGVPDELKGTKMIAFCVLKTKAADDLESELKNAVARDMGKPLAPSKIYFVSAIPKTRNAKVMRRVIRAAYLGEDAGDLSALENPQSVDEIRQLAKG